MKKIAFSVCFLLCLSSMAQDSKVSLGLNTSAIWNSYVFSDKTLGALVFSGRMNWSGGITSRFVLNKKFQLDAQVNFTTKNFGSGVDLSKYASIDWEPTNGNNSEILYSVRQNYLEIPISIMYFFPLEKKTSFFCSAGFTNSFFLSARYYGRQGFSVNSEVSTSERYKSYLLSLKTGGGIMFPMGKNFYSTAELYSNVYIGGVYSDHKNTPFQLAAGFSVLKKLGSKNTSAK